MRKKSLLIVIVLLIFLLVSGTSCYIHFYQSESIEKHTETEENVWESEKTETTEIIETEIVEILNTETEGIETETIEEPVEVSDETFVRVKTYVPDISIELKYAGADNFTNQKIYDFTDAYLRYGTVKKLMQVQQVLREKGLSLKIWDAFRPTSAQFVLWEICPDATYVANPHKGFSSHSRGNTIDITIVDEFGEELEMPTGFDDFSTYADRDYSDCTEEARENALFLETLMIKNGFKAYRGEWWHFTDETAYPVETEFSP
ncbi:MAG: M15 family metallopeptidase [Agathobacter sp.]|nr:M15 family metallopeptidase [Agathobacter sp.]